MKGEDLSKYLWHQSTRLTVRLQENPYHLHSSIIIIKVVSDPTYDILPKIGRCLLSYGHDEYEDKDSRRSELVNLYRLKYPVLMSIGWNGLRLMTPTVHLNTKTICLIDPTYAIFQKAEGSKISNMTFWPINPSTFVGQPDQTRPKWSHKSCHTISAEFLVPSRGPFWNLRSFSCIL